MPLVPALAIVFCGILIYMLPLVTQIRFVVWLLVGLAIYFGYGYSHSIISKTRRSAVPAGSAAANMNPAAQPTKGH
ncbi:amino acid permease C-terminal domain-containing protein [uncultured Megasphaera sp.]|uniref:amino acid permease C-terminal domain-containing protein n=1 Tax=uncultured Megasphaera sp. TaxID=165188 RepID=UPI002605C058|nr:amino acid permease C-terminal domain-containing protein [uncultured Megasphaera sp.]